MTGRSWKDSLSFFQSQLFHDVQSAGIFDDSKVFADVVPRQSYGEAERQYLMHEETGPEGLKAFVERHFIIPDAIEEPSLKQELGLREYIETLWGELKRPAETGNCGSLVPLSQAYLVPGGRFREIYYWDSYFTALGLVNTPHKSMIECLMRNFVELQNQVGLIPNGNRSYYATRSQPPVLALLLELLCDQASSEEAIRALCREYLPALEREHRFWMRGADMLNKTATGVARVVQMPCGALLNRFWDDADSPRPESYREDMEMASVLPDAARARFYRNIRAACESGWDFSSRWMKSASSLMTINTTNVVPVDLNCLLYSLEKGISDCHVRLGQSVMAGDWRLKADSRRSAIVRYLWDEDLGWFTDFRLDEKRKSPVLSLAGVLPLFCNIADDHQVDLVAHTLEKDFLHPGGLVTTTTHSQQQWDSPNGWAPLHWFAIKGLMSYGYDELATRIGQAWLNGIAGYYSTHGALMEKYDVVNTQNRASGGEYQVQHGFGWTNGVASALLDELNILPT